MILKKRKSISMVLQCLGVLSCGLLLTLLCGNRAMAAEAVICHEHTETCYTEGWVDCKDTVSISHYYQDFNCSGCQKLSSAIVVVETYVCSDGKGSREHKSTGHCCTCGTVVYTKDVSATEVHRRWEKICICGMSKDTVIAKADFTKSTEAWTNGDIVLNVMVTEPVSGVSMAPYTYAFSGGISNGTSCTVSENGTYSVTITASNGQQMTAGLKVDNIDKTPPQIKKCYVDKEYPEYSSANLIIEAADELSGLADKAYSFDGAKTFVEGYSFQISSNGNYCIVVKDKAGNCSNQTINVSCFAKRVESTNPAQSGQTTQTSKPATQSAETIFGEMSENNVKKEQNKEEKNKTETKEAYEKLKEKLEQSAYCVPLDKIPGVYSSLMRSNAEKNAVPLMLNVVKENAENAYSEKTDVQENLVKNILINEEKMQSHGTFAQVTKVSVAVGVLFCIGMMAFLIVFLVKKQ